MKVRYHVYKDIALDFAGASDEEIFQRDKKSMRRINKLRYSFVSMCWHPASRTLFLGTTNGDGDILVEFVPKTGKFRSCGFDKTGLGNEHEVKIHKGIALDSKENALYFGTATLSPYSAMFDSRGGSLLRYRIDARKFDRLANPTRGDYYQATSYDPQRKMMYFYTIRNCFGAYDLKARKLVRYEAVESTPHCGIIDDAGGAWGTYGSWTQGFFRYCPDKDHFEFPAGLAFPNAVEASDIMYRGAGPVDSILKGRDGCLYAGSALAELYRIDPVGKKIQFLGKPFPGRRLPGLAFGADGMLYMCGGSDKQAMLARYDVNSGRMETLGPVAAKDGASCFRCHELVVSDGTVYIGETDNPTRSGYLWACEV
jgi:hypothetical protein